MSSINVISGQASPVTVLVGNPNGEKWVGKFIAPPGRDAVLPDNIATKDQLGQMISGVMGMAPTDAQGLGIHWSVEGRAIFVYGNNPNNAIFTDLITGDNGVYRTSDNRCLPRMDGVSKKYLQAFIVENTSNAVTIPYPTAFASDNVAIFLCAQTLATPNGNGGTNYYTPNLSSQSITRANFVLSMYTPPDGYDPNKKANIFILAIGDLS